jgi:short subunit dehydrogenase-like uncharacterized protein
VVVFGATGFTGRLTAEYLARRAGAEIGVALAGRNRARLEEVRRHLSERSPACAQLPLLEADVDHPSSLRRLAESTRVLITTVGPYIKYGEPVVAACAAAGTDYLDLTGEPEFVDRMWLRYHAQAQRTGARLVHCCGFDSIPHDLGVLFTVHQLPEGVPIAIRGYVRAGGTFSGGTYQTAITAFGRLRQAAAVAAERRRREERPANRRVRGIAGLPRHDGVAGGWIAPLPTIDPQVVLRSARALHRYGPDFSYGHYLVAGNLAMVAALCAGTGALVALAQLAPTRRLLLGLRAPGEGPSPEQRERARFRVRFLGEGGGRTVLTEVSGGDPGYSETAKMLSEAALCLAKDELPALSGQLTPAVAMGQRLIDRLNTAGISFQVREGAAA